MIDLKNKVALIVGGSTGIGARTAEVFADAGARVVIGDIAVEPGEVRCAAIVARGGEAHFVRADAGSPADMEHLVADVIERFGSIHVLFNNAAAVNLLAEDRPVADLDVDVWDRTMAVNLRGAVLASKHVIPHMLRAGGGSIINTSSVRAINGTPINPAYSASKIGLLSLTRNIATMYGKRGVRCNAIVPGPIQSEVFLSNATPESNAAMLKQLLTPRLGTPDDIAHCALFLASDASCYIQGQVIPVDGGVSAHLPYYGDPDQ